MIVIYGDIYCLMEKEKIIPAQNGNDVYLTLDTKIQTFLEDAMNKVVLEYKPKENHCDCSGSKNRCNISNGPKTLVSSENKGRNRRKLA